MSVHIIAMEKWHYFWSLLCSAVWIWHLGVTGTLGDPSHPEPGGRSPSADSDSHLDLIAEHRHRILVVKRGRTAYLNPRVLLENPPQDGICMVQVVTNDPLTQRVGTLSPQVSSST